MQKAIGELIELENLISGDITEGIKSYLKARSKALELINCANS